jgi:hypothetical protein
MSVYLARQKWTFARAWLKTTVGESSDSADFFRQLAPPFTHVNAAGCTGVPNGKRRRSNRVGDRKIGSPVLGRNDMTTATPNPVSAPEQGDTPHCGLTPPPSMRSETRAVELPEQFGRYRILKALGHGGMGTVYLAHDSQLERRVALKVPSFTPEAGPEILQRFAREGRAAATIEHPNICPIYDVGEVNGIHFLTMAYVEGKPLSLYIDPARPLPQRQVAALVRKLALALREAHAHGVIHRDLKPSNILINQRAEPIITDFGIAWLVRKDETRLTKNGSVLGSPAYMAPEQIQGDAQSPGPACDIYSLGVILYQLLTGRLPFDGPMGVVMAQILTQEPEAPSKLRADLDPRLGEICRKAMAKNVAGRYVRMAEMAATLTEYIKGGRSTCSPVQGVAEAGAIQDATLEVLLANGRRLRVPRGFDAATLRQVLAVLEEERPCSFSPGPPNCGKTR